MWKAGEIVPAVGTLPAVYAAIPEPACTRPDTYYLRSAIERYAEEEPKSARRPDHHAARA